MDHWREALSHDPNLVQAHYLLGLILRDQGKLEEALMHLRTTTKLDPDNATLLCRPGRYSARAGRYGRRLAQAYGAALRLMPESASLHSNYGYLLVQKGDIDGAVAAWRTAVGLDPDVSSSLRQSGRGAGRPGAAPGCHCGLSGTFLELAPYAPNAEEIGQRLEALLQDTDLTPDTGDV